MNRLPYEILEEIFILLPPHQKLECMCVSRSWNEIIKESCLFHTVLITTHKNLDKLIQIFEDTPSNGKHVKQLILYIDDQFNDFIKSFLAFFPNLKSFYYYGPMNRSTTVGHMIWRNNRLENLKNKPLVGVCSHLLISNMFSHLKTLDLALSYRSMTTFLPPRMNAPNLMHLKLKGYRFRYSEVEKLDNCFPSLKTIKFWLDVLMDTRLPEDIKPNSSITCVQFKLRGISMANQCVLVRYISKKYTNLTNFTYDSGVPIFDGKPSNESPYSFALKNTLLSAIVCQGPQLKALKVLCSRLDFSHLAESIVPFRLVKWKLDLTRTSPEQLFLINASLPSTFCGLSVLTIESLCINDFRWLEPLEKLKALKIKHPQFTCLTLDSLMQHASHTIETLVIKDCVVEVGQDYRTLEKLNIDQSDSLDCSGHIHPLKKLKLSNVRIKENVDHFISHTCPGLQNLSIYNCLTSHLEFRLPNIHLLNFNIIKKRLIFIEGKDELWNYVWIHTKEENCLWHIEHSQHNRHNLNYFAFYGFQALLCHAPISNDALDDLDIWHFTFASVKHIGVSK